MKVAALRRLKREDLPNAPPSIDPLIEATNQTSAALNAALDRGISLADNVSGDLRDMEIRTAANYSSGEFEIVRFASRIANRAYAVDIKQVINLDLPDAVLAGPYSCDWRDLGGEIAVRWITGLDASKRYSIRFHVW